MKIEFYPSGIYRVLKISDLMSISSFDELRLLIDNYLDFNEKHIALNFGECCHMCSCAMAKFITCIKKIKDASGELCLLRPQPEIEELLTQMGLDEIVPVYESESEFPASH